MASKTKVTPQKEGFCHQGGEARFARTASASSGQLRCSG